MQNCCAEIIPARGETLVYRNVGADGQIDVEVNSPGVWGEIFPSHHPLLSRFIRSRLAKKVELFDLALMHC